MKPIVLADPSLIARSESFAGLRDDGYHLLLVDHVDHAVRVFYPPVSDGVGEAWRRPVVVMDLNLVGNPEVADELRAAGYIVVQTEHVDKVVVR